MTLTRRSFLGTAALATAAAGAQSQRKIGYAIVGLGRISMNQFMPGLLLSEKSKVVALVSGHRDKALKVAAKYGIAETNIYDYKNYEAMAQNPEIEAVYIALPNGMHAEYTIRAAQARKHVLCEKPMANTAAEAQQMIAACRKANRKLMIAYRLQFEPTNLRAFKMVREGQFGPLQVIEGTFGFNIRAGEWRLDRKLAGGGPLMDVGIYVIQAARHISGEEPVEITASSSVITQDGRFKEVEENVVWTMRFPSGVLASCSTSYGANIGNRYRAMGPKGWVLLEPAYSYDGLKMRYQLAGQQPVEEPTDDPQPRQFAREADHFSTCILENQEPRAPGEEGLRDQRIMDAIYRAAAEHRVVKV